jgi:hypothetical protein
MKQKQNKNQERARVATIHWYGVLNTRTRYCTAQIPINLLVPPIFCPPTTYRHYLSRHQFPIQLSFTLHLLLIPLQLLLLLLLQILLLLSSTQTLQLQISLQLLSLLALQGSLRSLLFFVCFL